LITFSDYIEYGVTNVCFKSKNRKINYEESHCKTIIKKLKYLSDED